MKINLEQFRTLVETGDVSAIEKHIFENALEKGDLAAAVKANKDIESERDQQLSNSLQTWKDNHLQKLIDDEVSKRNPEETPEQKEIRELKERLDAKEKAEQRTALKEKALAYATEKGYDGKFATKWIDRLLADDETATNSTLDEFKADFDAFVTATVEDTLKGSKRYPGGGNSSETKSYGEQLAEKSMAQSQSTEATFDPFK